MEPEGRNGLILHRIMDIILCLAWQNFALRGHRESLNSEDNTGNFMELVKLVSNYDPVLREHLIRTRIAPNITIHIFILKSRMNSLNYSHSREVKIVNTVKPF